MTGSALHSFTTSAELRFHAEDETATPGIANKTRLPVSPSEAECEVDTTCWNRTPNGDKRKGIDSLIRIS